MRSFPRLHCHLRQKAFTLVELLIVMAVIAVLLGILIPTINTVRSSGKKMDCMNRQRSTGIAMIRYTGDNKGYFPFYTNGDGAGSKKKMWYSIISDDWNRATESDMATMKAFDPNLIRNFFCAEDPNQRPDLIKWGTMQTNHNISIGYNLMGLGERNTGGAWDPINPTGMARITAIANPSEKIMIGDSWWNSWPNPNTEKYGHAQLGWVSGMTGCLYPRHGNGMLANLTCVDGRVISIKATTAYDKASLYRSAVTGGLDEGSLSTWWNRTVE